MFATHHRVKLCIELGLVLVGKDLMFYILCHQLSTFTLIISKIHNPGLRKIEGLAFTQHDILCPAANKLGLIKWK